MIITSQATVGGTAVPLVLVPPGPSSVTVTNGGTATLYAGAGTSVTSSDGAPVPAGAACPSRLPLVLLGEALGHYRWRHRGADRDRGHLPVDRGVSGGNLRPGRGRVRRPAP